MLSVDSMLFRLLLLNRRFRVSVFGRQKRPAPVYFNCDWAVEGHLGLERTNRRVRWEEGFKESTTTTIMIREWAWECGCDYKRERMVTRRRKPEICLS